MGGRGSQGQRTVRNVRLSLGDGDRQIRHHQSPWGDDESFVGRSGRRVHREKPLASHSGVRTKTDTGRQGENPKALERTLVKELGKMTP